ncbi:dTDP-4-dehydrorhamnose reductase [Rhizobium sp. 16-449-1b]|uniref:dTDP-4-dehydrorhamnose reductase n=1 Tax=Rhizobium sp. 16-449-1b TaxID=2819989 RepID=UPI001ADB80E3|nr:dTDP-4-dehydrorhamnose reductase [Rhizobium sp. 16-449-1b]MBO9197547.1 dTDP-4-dehydrorhamnose reductase [Rhizobium sp. 16-449-1b]
MTVLLLGKNGQLGRGLQRTLLPFGSLVAFARDEFDLDNPETIADRLDAVRPDIIVNAAAYTQVDLAEMNADAAFRANHQAVKMLADYARRCDALLVHYSTDYVFDGRQEAPYREDDETHPLNVYGQSKRAGELAITESGCRHLLFRTSWVVSADGTNFVKTILRLARERPNLRIVADQFGAPTAVELLADVTALAIAANRRGGLVDGTYHLTASGRTSWHGLALHIVQKATERGFVSAVDPADIEPITTDEFPRPAARPRNSSLNTDALSSALGLTLPEWTVHVDRVIDQLKERGWAL